MTVMHSVASSACSWCTTSIIGLIPANIALPAWTASTRGPARCVAGVGGGTLSPASHISNPRLRGSWSKRRLSSVVPARNIPITTIGDSMRSSATSGWFGDPVDHPQPVRQGAHEHAGERDRAEVVEARVASERLADRREAVAEVVGPEVLQPGRRARVGEEHLGSEVGHTAPRSVARGAPRAGVRAG